MGITEDIREASIALIEAQKDGLRYSELMRAAKAAFPTTPHGTLTGAIWNLAGC